MNLAARIPVAITLLTLFSGCVTPTKVQTTMGGRSQEADGQGRKENWLGGGAEAVSDDPLMPLDVCTFASQRAGTSGGFKKIGVKAALNEFSEKDLMVAPFRSVKRVENRGKAQGCDIAVEIGYKNWKSLESWVYSAYTRKLLFSSIHPFSGVNVRTVVYQQLNRRRPYSWRNLKSVTSG